MKAYVANKKGKAPKFQVLLLDNDAADEVEIQEADQVNFFQVKEHLRNGGSVFITSKDSQKQRYPRAEALRNYSKSRRTYGVLFHEYLRGS
jgi:predicted Fe-Mo cluster-binding NifX family protein